jgi:hypothetical protein
MQLVLQQVYTMKIYIFRSDENQPDRGKFQFLSIVLFFKMCSAVTPFVMSPNVIFERRLQVDNGLFVFLSATENENYWCKLTERHLSLFLQGFDDVDPGVLYPACRHYFSRIHSLDYYYE